MCAMVEELMYGLMAQDTKANSSLIRRREKGGFSMRMETNTTAIGSMIKLRAKVSIRIPMVRGMKVSGMKIFSMGKVLKLGSTGANTKGNTTKVKRQGLVSIRGLMVAAT